MEDTQEARTWWKQWIWVEKLIFPVSVTQKEQLLGVLIFEFNFDANLRLPSIAIIESAPCPDLEFWDWAGIEMSWTWPGHGLDPSLTINKKIYILIIFIHNKCYKVTIEGQACFVLLHSSAICSKIAMIISDNILLS